MRGMRVYWLIQGSRSGAGGGAAAAARRPSRCCGCGCPGVCFVLLTPCSLPSPFAICICKVPQSTKQKETKATLDKQALQSPRATRTPRDHYHYHSTSTYYHCDTTDARAACHGCGTDTEGDHRAERRGREALRPNPNGAPAVRHSTTRQAGERGWPCDPASRQSALSQAPKRLAGGVWRAAHLAPRVCSSPCACACVPAPSAQPAPARSPPTPAPHKPFECKHANK